MLRFIKIFLSTPQTLCTICTLLLMNLHAAEIQRSEIETSQKNACTIEDFTLHSKLMQRDIAVRVILPPEYDKNPDKDYPILYTLHGAWASHKVFSDMLALRKSLSEKPMIVAMFDAGHLSFYLDAAQDGKTKRDVIVSKPKKNKKMSENEFQAKLQVWNALPSEYTSLYTSFFFKEYMPTLDKHYRTDSSKRAVSGFSMGGFGALYLCIQEPKIFTSCSGLSSAFYDHAHIEEKVTNNKNNFHNIIGTYDDKNKPEYDKILLISHIKTCAAQGLSLPPIYQHCGTEDFLIENNRQMAQATKESGFDITYKESPGGHNWSFWNGNISQLIDFHWEHFQE
ncbi:MAG: hypothetical protein HRU15_04875 [Planctomycetes bacterium]|nr:hypothetical protein [Planctomycetota bacterium]